MWFRAVAHTGDGGDGGCTSRRIAQLCTSRFVDSVRDTSSWLIQSSESSPTNLSLPVLPFLRLLVTIFLSFSFLSMSDHCVRIQVDPSVATNFKK